MISGYPIWVVLLIGCGVFCASFVDAIGGGGGLITLPAYMLAGVPVHQAIATNKLSSTCGTALATVRFIREGLVNWRLAVPTVLMAVIGRYHGEGADLRAAGGGHCGAESEAVPRRR